MVTSFPCCLTNSFTGLPTMPFLPKSCTPVFVLLLCCVCVVCCCVGVVCCCCVGVVLVLCWCCLLLLCWCCLLLLCWCCVVVVLLSLCCVDVLLLYPFHPLNYPSINLSFYQFMHLPFHPCLLASFLHRDSAQGDYLPLHAFSTASSMQYHSK